MKDSGQVVKVNIFGNDYPIRARVEDEGYVREIASYIDSKMKEINESMRPSTTAKVAILAALNIADELMSLRKKCKEQECDKKEQLEVLSQALDSVLEE